MSIRAGWTLDRLIICAACALLAVSPEIALAQNQPNILFVLTDDVGWGDVKTYNPESKVSLPTIETLAAEGMFFTDAHTSAAKCAPSRYSIISGNYQWRGKKNWGQWQYKGGSQVLRIVVHEPGPGLLAWMDPVMLRPKGRSGGLVQAVGELVLGGFANSLARTPRRRGGAVCCEDRSREDRHYECQAC